MEFENMRIKDIAYIINYTPKVMHFTSKNKPQHIIGVTLNGESFHHFDNGRTLTLSENCIYYLNKDDDYTVDVLEKGEVISIHFETYEPIDTPSFCIKLHDISEIVSLIEKIKGLYSPSQKADVTVLSHLYELCSIYDGIRSKKYAAKDSRLIMAKKHIDLHFCDKSCLEDAAVICNITRRHFNDIFKKQFNVTPNHYLTFCKIQYARQLLGAENFSISEVAMMCGFANVYYFTKVFTDEVGISPSKFKKSKSK